MGSFGFSSGRSSTRALLCTLTAALFFFLAVLPFFHWVLLPNLSDLYHASIQVPRSASVLQPLASSHPSDSTDSCLICAFFSSLLRTFLLLGGLGVLSIAGHREWFQPPSEPILRRYRLLFLRPRSPPSVTLLT